MKHVLILEDTLEVLAVLLDELARLERKSAVSLRVTVYSTSDDVADIVNHQSADTYDVIILDRNCKLGGSFHALDIERFGGEKVISISSLPHLNEQARTRGVERVVDKDHHRLGVFAREVALQVQRVLDV